jgi:hypothetical protein
MIILDSTNKSWVISAGATPTTGLSYYASYVDLNTFSVSLIGATGGTFGLSNTTIISAPAANTQRQVKYASIVNNDSASHTVTSSVNIGGSLFPVFRAVMEPNYTLVYQDDVGWALYDSLGNPRLGGGTTVSTGNPLTSRRWMDLANISTATSLASNATVFVHVGTAQKTSSSVEVLYRVATGASGAATWAEVGIFKGNVVFNGNATLTRLGYTDISGTGVTVTGIKKTTVSVSPSIQIGDDIWVAMGGQYATTQWQARGGLADDLQSGCFQISTTTRISTLTSPFTSTLASATAVPPWVYVNLL